MSKEFYEALHELIIFYEQRDEYMKRLKMLSEDELKKITKIQNAMENELN